MQAYVDVYGCMSPYIHVSTDICIDWGNTFQRAALRNTRFTSAKYQRSSLRNARFYRGCALLIVNKHSTTYGNVAKVVGNW